MYERMFREYGRTVGQILLTKEDSTGRHSYLNFAQYTTYVIATQCYSYYQ